MCVTTAGPCDGEATDRATKARDMAVVLPNKRGVGESEGNWMRQRAIEGRADDMYAVVEHFREHPAIDAANVGVIGHSQGGWVVQHVAAEHEDIPFFISLAGPTTSVWRNIEDNSHHLYSCQGFEGADLERKIEQKFLPATISN